MGQLELAALVLWPYFLLAEAYPCSNYLYYDYPWLWSWQPNPWLEGQYPFVDPFAPSERAQENLLRALDEALQYRYRMMLDELYQDYLQRQLDEQRRERMLDELYQDYLQRQMNDLIKNRKTKSCFKNY